MKKVLIICFIFLLVGCSLYTPEKKIYLEMVEKLKEVNTTSLEIPFNIDVELLKNIDSEITYRVIIDEPNESVENIRAIITHNMETSNIYPSVGIFDSSLNLIPGEVDKENNIVKGFVLTGYIPFEKNIEDFDGIIKVLIEYEVDGILNTVYYIYEK